MLNCIKKSPLLLCSLFTLFLSFSTGAYEVTLKGGSEIKEGAEKLKQTAEIISKLVTLQSIKMLLLILLGFVIALQGILMVSKGLFKAVGEQRAIKRGILLSILGITFLCGGISVIFIDEVFNRIQNKAHMVLNKPSAWDRINGATLPK